MATFVLVPGAGGVAWYWHLVVPRLQAAGHSALPVDLPGDDAASGLPEYAALIAAAAEARRGVVLVAQSMGAFSAVPACAEVRPSALVLVNAMVPAPGETATAWWGNVGSEDARLAAAREGGWPEAFDLDTYFMHDVSPDVVAASAPLGRNEHDVAFEQPCAFERWPDVPTTVLAGTEDRFFPFALQDRVARERAGVPGAVPVPGGHLNALSQPDALTAALLDAAVAQPGRSAA